MRRTLLTWTLWLALLSAGCAAPPAPTPTETRAATLTPSDTAAPEAAPTQTETATATSTPAPHTERVLIISMDGFRPDALDPGRTPALMALAARGASSFTAQTIVPSVTLPAHASMLTGYDLEDHGVTWNDYIPANGFVRTATIFSLAHEAGYRTVMVVTKEKLVHLALPGTVDEFLYQSVGDFALAEIAAAEIAEGFGVLFVHFAGPDAAGHLFGWMSASYLGTVHNTDIAVGRLLEALGEAGLAESTLVIVTADHGGHGMGHGTSLPEDMTVPWIIAGPGVVPGVTLRTPVRVLDTAPTAAWALGLPLPGDMDGAPVLEAFGL
jgi:arylsulfatase A-like enzyme